jgi:putative monooxygenase
MVKPVQTICDQDLSGAAVSRALVREHIASGKCDPFPALLPVEIREFVSARCHAQGLSTGTATFPPGAELPYHTHRFSEAVTVLQGEIEFHVQGRHYRLSRLDCIHLPAGVAHRVVNTSATRKAVAHSAFATSEPSRDLVADEFPVVLFDRENPTRREPEHIVRFQSAAMYPLADGTRFYDLFAGRFGSVGICGGYGEFEPGASLPCHVHNYDESITIVTGEAICQVAGKQYRVADCDTAFIPEGRPHRFLNGSDQVMAMIWVYAGSEPERTLVSVGYCDGGVRWLAEREFQ